MNHKLSIVIPTYNRNDILSDTIDYILDEVIVNDLLIYIVDDSTNDETCNNISKKYNKISNIIYLKNDVNLGHDKNFFKTISIVKEEFVWYLGDSMLIKKGVITNVLNIIDSSDCDFIVLNEESRSFTLQDNLFIDYQAVLVNIGWHLTMSGVTIYNLKTFKNFLNKDYSLYKNFPQTALIIDYIRNNDFKLLWLGDKCIFGNKNKISYWSNNVFEVFLDDLESTLKNTDIPDKFVEKLIKDHSFFTKIFSINKLIKYRSIGFYDINKFLHYKSKIHLYTNTNIFLAFILSIFNKPILRFILKFIPKS
jgi:glycosyltransferase involved in cell wall biosynthesis